MNRKIIELTFSMIMILITFTACGPDEYFKDPDSKYEQQAVKDDSLEKDVYYVKNGTDFTPAYECLGTAKGAIDRQDDERVLWANEKESRLIPTLYGSEFIAYRSEATGEDLGEAYLERFYDVGYSLGIYGMTFDDDKYLSFSVKKNTVEGSNAQEIFSNANSDNIRIVSINGKSITRDMCNRSGVFLNLKKDKEYRLTFYAGTAYQSARIMADTRMFTSYETFNLGEGKLTRKDYLQYDMPNGAKSGYYLMNGVGMFRYFNFQRGENDEKKENMNVPYYKDNNEQMRIYSQQYSVNVPKRTFNMKVYVKYDTKSHEDKQIACTLVSPDDKLYKMKPNKGLAEVSLDEAMAGRWIVNIYPKDLVVNDVGVDSSAGHQRATKNVKKYNLKRDESNVQFCAEYKGDGTVWGTVTYEDGTSQDMMIDDDKKILSATFDYAKKGKYTVEIYHYEDVKVERFYRQNDNSMEKRTVITVEE